MRRRARSLLGAAAIVWATCASASSARADEPTLSPPKLSRFVEAADPRAPGAAARAVVELELDVDREGKVARVRVAQSAGAALDDAATRAAREFVFDPATRDGKAVAARVRYAYVFDAREARDDATPPNAAPAPAPAPAPADAPAPAPAPPAGAAQDTAGAPAPALDPEAFGASARVEAPPREVTKRTLEREELTRVAGTRGDPLRAVELLPGVSRPAGTEGPPILRGANPNDSQVFIEGAPSPALYHVGGFTSVVHARVLDSVELHPSNFSVRYGRKVGGVIEARLRDPRMDRLHGALDVSLLDSSLVVETPLGSRFGVLAAVRRSNIDAVLNAATSNSDLAITSAPVYWDYQSVAIWKPTDADRVRVLSYGSSDRLAILFKRPSDVDPAFRGELSQSTVFHRVQLGYRHRWSGGSEQNTELTYGRMDETGLFGPLGRSQFAIDTVQLRSEWTGVIAPAARVVVGVDALANHFSGSYEGIPPMPLEGQGPTAFASQKKVEVTASRWVQTPGAYVELGLRPVPRVLVTPGMRVDYNDLIRKVAVDPRLSARWEVTDATALKAGVGHFSQGPREPEAVRPIGNPDLRMTRAVHVSAGVEHRVTEDVSASVEGFTRRIQDIVTGTPGGRPPSFVNGQEGRVFGAELMLRMRPAGRFFGFVSYTLMRSERRDPGLDWRLFDRDQPHILGASAGYRLGRGWEVGASFRFTSGTPYTPVTSSTYDATTDIYLPRLGAPMSARNPAFSRLDVRVEKKWTFSAWSLSVYADVQNVLFAENREGFSYSYDYARREGVRGLPIFPSLGLRGEL